jgi:hypothetical protein
MITVRSTVSFLKRFKSWAGARQPAVPADHAVFDIAATSETITPPPGALIADRDRTPPA